MRALAVLLLLCVLWLGPAPARADEAPANLPPADRDAIQGVIESQMRAFGGDDAEAAFAFASPGIRLQFGDAATFLQMVRRGYAPVYHPRRHSFGALVTLDGAIVQKVQVLGPDGVPALALYVMEKQPDGSWKIGGCMLTESQDVGA